MRVNGKDMDVREGITVIELLKDLDINPERVVVEVDFEIINKDEYVTKKLSSESEVEVIRFVGGG